MGKQSSSPQLRLATPYEGTTMHHAAPLEARLLDRNFLSICALLDISSLYCCCSCANCNMQGFLVRGLPSGWRKEGASSTPRSCLSLSANWRSRASSGTSLACAMVRTERHSLSCMYQNGRNVEYMFALSWDTFKGRYLVVLSYVIYSCSCYLLSDYLYVIATPLCISLFLCVASL